MEAKYTEEDLRKAFEAGENLTNQKWHEHEFCSGETCPCKPLPFNNFEEWLKIKSNE